MKNLLIGALVLASLNTMADGGESCAYDCRVVQKSGNSELVMKPIGGFTNEMNTRCQGKIGSIKIEVASIFDHETHLMVEDGKNSFSSSSPKAKGKYSLSASGITVECYK